MPSAEQIKLDLKEFEEKIQEATDLTQGLGKEIATALKGGLLNAEQMVKDLASETTKVAKARKKLYEDTVDLTVDILKNQINIGTEEFRIFDVAVKLAKARREGDDDLIAQLEHLRDISKEHERQNKLIKETINLAKKPFEAIDSFIRQIPIVGELISAALDVTGISDSIGDSIRAGFQGGASKGVVQAEKEVKGGRGGIFATIFQSVFGGLVEGATSGITEAVSAAEGGVGAVFKNIKSALLGDEAEFDLGYTDISGTASDAANISEEMIKQKGGARNLISDNIEIANQTEAAADNQEKTSGLLGLITSKTGLWSIAIGGTLYILSKIVGRFKQIADQLGTDIFSPGWAESWLNPAAAVAFATEFGVVGKMSATTALNALLIEKRFNVSAENVAKLAKAMSNVSSASDETLTAQIYTNSMLARAEGLAPKLVMEDVAANTELFAKYAKDGGDNIFAAARQAAKLGISLSDVSSAAESLLDFESSIEKQLEAEILLGRGLNLDYARRLSFAGDLEGLQKELVRLVGSENEWNKLNFVQRDAMAKAIGMNVEGVASMVGAQERVRDRSRDVVEALNDTFSAFVAMLPAIMAVAGVLIGIIPAMRGAATYGASLWAEAGAVAKGVAFAAAAGTAGFAAGKVIQSQIQPPGFQDLPEGKMVQAQRGEGTFHEGEFVGHMADFNELKNSINAGNARMVAMSLNALKSTKESDISELIVSSERGTEKMVKAIKDTSLVAQTQRDRQVRAYEDTVFHG